VRVVVADDVMLTREGIVRLLRDASIDVIAEAEDAEALLRYVRLAHPDVALIDIRMPPTHADEGLVAAQAIRAEHPQVASFSCPSTPSPATPCGSSRSTLNGSATYSRSASSTSPTWSTPSAASWTEKR
jgi:DNA-binding NarL/FixJ family response regulator